MEPTEETILDIVHYPEIKSSRSNSWYISHQHASELKNRRYLHKDGEVRVTATCGGEMTGYWKTKAGAIAFHTGWKHKYLTKNKEENTIKSDKIKRVKRVGRGEFLSQLKENGYG